MLFVNMGDTEGNNFISNAVSIPNEGMTSLGEEVNDDNLIDTSQAQLAIVDSDSASHHAFCGRCRAISSSFLGTSLLSQQVGLFGTSESCRYDESVQQFFASPDVDDDVPLLNVSFGNRFL